MPIIVTAMADNLVAGSTAVALSAVGANCNTRLALCVHDGHAAVLHHGAAKRYRDENIKFSDLHHAGDGHDRRQRYGTRQSPLYPLQPSSLEVADGTR